jgi:hypothetical protein
MASESLACLQCEAPLQVTATTFSLSCPACGQWHTVDRSGTAPLLRLFEEAVAREEPGAHDDAEPEPNEAIRRLDEHWDAERKKYLVFGLTGEETTPDVLTAGLVMLAGLVVGALLAYQARTAGMIQQVIGVGFGAALVGFGYHRWQKAHTYQSALRKYQGLRRASQLADPKGERK